MIGSAEQGEGDNPPPSSLLTLAVRSERGKEESKTEAQEHMGTANLC